MDEIQGRCLCGACSYKATPVSAACSVCHCETCRRWAGMQFSVDVGGSVRAVEGPVSRYASSSYMNRISCSKCGAPLYREVPAKNQFYAIMQCFEDPSDFDLAMEIYIDEKPPNYALEGDHPRLTGKQFEEMMAKG